MHVVSRPSRQSVRHVAILLATYNGERFLGEQLETLRRQQVEQIDIWASDDRSDDGTRGILKAAQKTWQAGRLHILDGPGKGFAENFRSLILNPNINADGLPL